MKNTKKDKIEIDEEFIEDDDKRVIVFTALSLLIIIATVIGLLVSHQKKEITDDIKEPHKDYIIPEPEIGENKKNIEEAKDALKKATDIAKKMKLDMKFLDADFTFDKTQLIFHFIAENRVDFRELAKSLASIYKVRIELRQVGVRDKAKEISGIGQCGRKLCCSNFLKDLDSVGIAQVKNQSISLNPSKINGQCGRLLCCLKYEDENYSFYRKDMPEVGQKVKIGDENGIVISIDILNRKYTVNTESNNKIVVEVPLKKYYEKQE